MACFDVTISKLNMGFSFHCIPCNLKFEKISELVQHLDRCEKAKEAKQKKEKVHETHDPVMLRISTIRKHLPMAAFVNDTAAKYELQKIFNRYLVEIGSKESTLRGYIEIALRNAINKECLASWRLGLWKSVSMAEYKANFKFDPPKISNHEEYILYIHQEQDKWKVYKIMFSRPIS
jgi:hypothetical protein